jgi:hypothetical protein
MIAGPIIHASIAVLPVCAQEETTKKSGVASGDESRVQADQGELVAQDSAPEFAVVFPHAVE